MKVISISVLFVVVSFLAIGCQRQNTSPRLSYFDLRVPASFDVLPSNDLFLLINGKDTVRVKEGWNQTWEFKYDILRIAYNNNPRYFEKKLSVNENFIETDSLPPQYYGHHISYASINGLFMRSALPDELGYTDILLENQSNNLSLRIFGKNLSKQTIEYLKAIIESVTYNNKLPIKTVSVTMDECNGPVMQVIDTNSGESMYEVYPQLTVESQIDGKKAFLLKTQYPCCTRRTINVQAKGKEIQFVAQELVGSRVEYIIEEGIQFRDWDCGYTCTYCHHIVIDGLADIRQYKYFFDRTPLLPVKSDGQKTLKFQAAE